MGYENPFYLPLADPNMMQTTDLFVDVKAHQTYHRIIEKWPNLKNKVLWYRINGGKPEHVIDKRGDHGDEVNPPCPVLTPNQWYKEGSGDDLAYTCYPPFHRFSNYYQRYGRP